VNGQVREGKGQKSCKECSITPREMRVPWAVARGEVHCIQNTVFGFSLWACVDRNVFIVMT